MELSKLTSEQLITLNSDLSSKDEIIKFLVSKLYQAEKYHSRSQCIWGTMCT